MVIPAFNEGRVIGRLVRSVRSALGSETEILVVDDGSTDGTDTEAAAAGARVIRIPRNQGNGSAVKAGIRAARGEFVALMDGDGQHDVGDLLRLLLHAGEYDMVVGARDPSTHASFSRRLANGLYNRLASYLTGQRIEDLTSGFRVIRRSVAEEFLSLLPNGFSYPTTITLASLRAGYSVLYVPFRAGRRTGSSKIRMLRDGPNFALIMFKVITLFSPLKVFLPLAALPALGAMPSLVLAGLGVSELWLVGTMLLACSLVLTGLGLVSEQITAMRFERLNLFAEGRLRLDGVHAATDGSAVQ